MTPRNLRPSGRTVRPLLLIVALLACGVALATQLGGSAISRAAHTTAPAEAVLASSQQGAPVPGAQPGNWRTLFQDTFTGPRGAAPDANWEVYTGSNIGVGTYTASGAHLDGAGHLVLTAGKVAGHWQSSWVDSKASFAPAVGHSLLVESRMSLPSAPGLWPAFWALAETARVNSSDEPAAGEDDIAETINGSPWVAQIMHCGVSRTRGPCRGSRTFHVDYMTAAHGKSSMHTYAWLWYNNGPRSYVAFYLDSRLQVKLTEAQIGARYWKAAFDHPYFLIYDLALGGWAGKPGPATPRSASMLVDNVRVLTS